MSGFGNITSVATVVMHADADQVVLCAPLVARDTATPSYVVPVLFRILEKERGLKRYKSKTGMRNAKGRL